MRRFATLILVALLARPLASAHAKTSDATAGDKLVGQALAELQRHESIAVSVLMQATFRGRQLEIGDVNSPSRYYQSWNPSRDKLLVRWDLHGHVEGTPVKWLQLSDGNRLWNDLLVGDHQQVTGIDLRRIRRDLDSGVDLLPALPVGQAQGLPIESELAAHHGGLPMLLAGLRKHFRFSPPVLLSLSNTPVLGTIGVWRSEELAKLAPASVAPHEPAPLPENLPASVMLLVGQDDLFPYVVEYRRSVETPAVVDANPSLYQMQPNSLMLLQLYERSFDAPVSPAAFEYAPRETDWTDLTANRLRRLRKERKSRLASSPQQQGRER